MCNDLTLYFINFVKKIEIKIYNIRIDNSNNKMEGEILNMLKHILILWICIILIFVTNIVII